jgi:hypothetical protein
MLDELSQFLFNQNSIAGWEYQNWMLVIGLPIAIFFTYLSQRGFHWRSADPPAEPKNPNESPHPNIPDATSFWLTPAQLAFPHDALVRLGRMFDPVMKLAAGSWKPLRHHVSSRSWIDCSTCGGMKLHVVTDREPVGHCID